MATVCDACGLPPHPNRPLLQCTRCKQAHYHDRRCQKDHYPKHKASCRRIVSNAASSEASSPPNTTSRVECRTIEGRGRSMVATSPISIGSNPLSSSSSSNNDEGEDGLCEPIAHPVLLESYRIARCSYCFTSIRDDPDVHDDDARRGRNRLHRHCSSVCRNLDVDWIDEERASRRLPSPPSPTALSCARLLRRFERSPAARNEYEMLCHDDDANSTSEEERGAYSAILTQCHLFLLAMEDASSGAARAAHDLLYPDVDNAVRFMSRMCKNGFTVSDSEQFPIGHGVYRGRASYINHSCRSNCVPTFWLRRNAPPMLRITACRTIGAGEEVTIGYCDVSAPRRVRRETLRKNYKFLCDCSLCEDGERDDAVVGLKCTSRGCEGGGTVRCRVARARDECDDTRGEGGRDDKNAYRCDACGNSDFRDALDEQDDSMIQMKRLESAMNNGRGVDDRVGEEMRRIYERLKRCCQMQTSYYIAWSSDLCVCWYANALKFLSSEEEQLNVCRMALALLDESRRATRYCLDYPGSLSWHVKRGTEAKLRLFSNPMDMEALETLQQVRKVMLVYYPPSDDLIFSLDESLRAYSFS